MVHSYFQELLLQYYVTSLYMGTKMVSLFVKFCVFRFPDSLHTHGFTAYFHLAGQMLLVEICQCCPYYMKTIKQILQLVQWPYKKCNACSIFSVELLRNFRFISHWKHRPLNVVYLARFLCKKKKKNFKLHDNISSYQQQI